MRLLKYLIIVAIVSISSVAFAAGTITFATYGPGVRGGKGGVQIVATCTADASDASYPIKVLPTDMTGMYLNQVRVKFGGTAPTANSDLEILEHSSTGYDILNGAGSNLVDAVTNSDFQATINSVPSSVYVYGDLYIKITNNAVNSALTTIILDFIQLD